MTTATACARNGAGATTTGGIFGRLRERVPTLAAVLCLLTGMVDVVDGLTPALDGRMHELSPLISESAARGAASATVVVGVLLVFSARGLRRRKRRAHVLVCALLMVSVALHLMKGLDIEEAVAAEGLLALLLAFHGCFPARSDPRGRRRGLGVAALLLLASVGIGIGALHLPWVQLQGQYSLFTQTQHALRGLVGISGPVQFAATAAGARAADTIGDTMFCLGLLTALVPTYLVLRPISPVARLDAPEESRLRALLDRHGSRDSLSYFALRRDKSLVWSPTGKAAIAYRVVGGVMLASGDPLGDAEAWPGAIKEFLRIAAHHAWTPAVMSCGEQSGRTWARHGLAVLELGDEAIVRVADFGLDGRAMRNVRQMVHRIARQGYSCDVRRIRDVPVAERSLLRAKAAAWRGTVTERGFSMALGRLADPEDGDCVVATTSRHGRLCAILHFVPWGADALSLDLMRRDRNADAGLNELLIVAALRAAPGLGVTQISLNFAMFRSTLARGERLGAGPALRSCRKALVFLSRWFQIESLYRFNAKFQPRWIPRFVCFPSSRELPRVAVAAARAEGFLSMPRPHVATRRFAARGHVPRGETQVDGPQLVSAAGLAGYPGV